jgi:adenylate kinase family enzyme
MKYFICFMLFVFISPVPASAQDINGQCKVAVENHDFETDVSLEYCDYHDRRFDYKRRRDEFRANLEARQANYQAQRQVVIDAYQAKEDALHGF